jgi:preprotein translocase subunit SecB
MIPHPIALEHVYFTKVLVEAVPTFQATNDSKKATYLPENTLEVKALSDSPKKFIAIMSTKINTGRDPIDPYAIEMQCVGIFSADDTLDMPEAVRGVHITAHTVLYGAIRESISWITGRQPFGPLQVGLSVLQPSPSQNPEAKPTQPASNT